MTKHPTKRSAFAQRIAPTGLTLHRKLNLPPERLESFFALPRPEEVQVIRPPERARKGAWDYLYLVQADASHRHSTWYVRMRPARGGYSGRWSTGCRENELDLAKQAYLDCMSTLRDQELKRIVPGAQPVSAIIEEYIEHQNLRVHALNTLKRTSLSATLDNVARLIPFIQDKTVADIDQDTSIEWMRWAKEPKPAGGGYSHNTAVNSIMTLRAALEFGLKSHGYLAPFELPHQAKVHNGIFLPAEIDRVPIAAVNGWIWDPLTGDWKVTFDRDGRQVRATTNARLKQSVKAYGRFFLLAIWFGSRRLVTSNLTWTDEGGPWLNLERGILHRLGTKEEESSKRKGHCVIPEEIMPMLKAWREEDRSNGCRYVLHDKFFAPLKFCTPTWYRLLEISGVRRLKPHACKHTCVHILKMEGVTLRMAADYLLTSEQALVKHYGPDWDIESTRAAAVAIGSMTKFRSAHPPTPRLFLAA